VRLDDGQHVTAYFKEHAAVTHGHAATLHKAQGHR
jgi:ATP-dependent exoDNAse (exonuclease V) alpha subunit